MKTSNTKHDFLGYLKQVYGNLPLESLMDDKDKAQALDIGNFEMDAKHLRQAALDDDANFDYLIGWYNQKNQDRRDQLRNFKGILSASVRELFSDDFYKKENSFEFVPTIQQLRLKYLNHIPTEDEKQESLSQFKAQIALHQEKLLSKIPASFFFDKKQGFKALFPFSNRARNVQIIGGAGSGKSELIKLFIYHDMQCGKSSFLLDPHGDLASEIAQLRCKHDKIVYLSAEFGNHGYYFKYNPFSHDQYDAPESIREAFITVKAQELLNAFSIIMKTEFSHNMERIIFNCLQILLSHKGMNLKDFLRFLRSATSAAYEELAAQHPSENVRLFFAHDFNEKRYELTKASILTRFENSLANYHLAQIFDCEESSFDLKTLLNQGYCILFNLSQGLYGESGCRLLGSFIMAELTTLALQKAKIPVQYRKSWMGYIDETQNFLTPRIDKILSEARKYKLSLTLANQFLGQIESPRLKASILCQYQYQMFGL